MYKFLDGKKRYIILLAALFLLLQSFGVIPGPVRPFIQLPGEVYPKPFPAIGLTNTFVSSLVAFVIVLLIALSARAWTRTPDEVPTGFYNFFEMVIEGAYNFAENIGGKKVRDFFPFFMTYILFILVANWMGLMPGVDSIGFWEYKPHFYAEKEIKAIETELKAENPEQVQETLVALTEEYHLEKALDWDGSHLESEGDELLHAIEHVIDLENRGDKRSGADTDGDHKAEGMLLVRADTQTITDESGAEVTVPADDSDWTIVPFLRPAATDLNFTLAFALIAMTMVQYFGIKYLGVRGYFSKFFPFIGKGWGAQVAKNPIKAIDPAVGILELVSEISKIISFAFRLLGNIFAGMVLLFVMAFLLPAANIVFFGLEFFVGLIQALVFGLLMLIFMVSATEHHGDHDDEHH